MKSSRLVAWILVGLTQCLVFPASAYSQWGVTAKAALPAIPYWWTASEKHGIDLVPLVWSNEVDGSEGSGCCVLGAAGRLRLGPSTLWLGLGFGTDAKAGTPAAIEVAGTIDGGAFAFRSLHGRSGFAAFYPVLRDGRGLREGRISIGVSSTWLFDARYIPPVPFFECSSSAPSLPCEPVDTPYPWSGGEDVALAGEAEWGRGEWSAPRLEVSLGVGVKIAGGDYSYLRADLSAEVYGKIRRLDWILRMSGGWASSGSPMQRRFLMYGAGPIHRWLNPYLDVKGALFQDVAYIVPGGPNLRAYQITQPLADGYVGAMGMLSRSFEAPSGLWGRADGYLETAWIPGIPDRLGPEQMNEDASFLFDWQQLPEGEGQAQGEFRARSLHVSNFWADAGLALTGGYRNVALMVSFPLWASEPDFANERIGGGERNPFTLRGTLTIVFFPLGRPGA